MKLFRISVWDKYKIELSQLYVIQENKERAIDYVNTYLKSGYEINKIYHLGDELSGRMFAKKKNKGKA